MSLRVKLALSGTLLLALSVGLMMFYTLGALQKQFAQQQEARVLQLRPLLNSALSVPLVQRDFASVQAILEESLGDPALQQIRVHDAAGRLVAMARRPSSPDDASNGLWSEYRTDLSLAGQILGAVTFTLSNEDLVLAQAQVTRQVLSVGFLVLVLFSVLLWVLSGTVTWRLGRLVEASRSIRQGHYAPHLPAPSEDEVGDLVKAFSVMALEIQRKVDEWQQLNDQLEQQVNVRTRDLTLRTQELAESVRALQTKTYLLNRAPFAVLVLDASTPDFLITDSTDALFDLFGHEVASLKGKSVGQLEPPEQVGVMTRQLQSATESLRSMEWEAEVVCGSGGTRWTRCLAFALHEVDPYRRPVALCLVDIQELWQAREDQRRLTGEIQESSKLQSVGLAIAGIAHDLNTPMGIALTASTKMRSMLDAALKSGNAPDGGVNVDPIPVARDQIRKWQHACELVSGNLTKASSLVTGLKTTSANATRLEWRKVALLPLFEALLVTLSPITHRANCTVRLTCPSDLSVFTEPGSVGQVVTNLVVNATVHAFEGCSQRELHIEVSQSLQQIEIRVADNGNGMSDDAAAKVFTPFYTTRRELGGSGLGLFSARRVVEEVLGGRISMVTSPGAGTTFHVVLPLLEQPPVAVSRSTSQETARSQSF